MSDDFQDPSNPAAAAQIAEILAEANTGPTATKPTIDPPPDSVVRLSGGSRMGDTPILQAEVVELTGADEERLAKARVNGSNARWYSTLLQCGVAEINGQEATPEALDALLVGDRESLVLGIRAATYGPVVEYGEIRCPSCHEVFEASTDIKDIPSRPMVGEPTFEVRLRKGGVAKVRLPNGADQMAYTEDQELTQAERNSILLSRCVITLPGDLGEMPVAGFPSMVRDLGVVDRKNILNEIDKRMPGPRYDEVRIVHEECSAEIPVPPGLMPLFPGL